MLVTPLLHHAAAVLVMGPVAAAVAKNLGYGPDAFLMAVAFGAACDFLTPIGHQNSTLVMGPGGYRFSDYGGWGCRCRSWWRWPGPADPAVVAAAIDSPLSLRGVSLRSTHPNLHHCRRTGSSPAKPIEYSAGASERSEEVALAQLHAAMAQDVVRGRRVEIEVRQTEVQQVGAALE